MPEDRIKRIPVHESTKGSLGQNDDTWTLLINSATGEKLVEHEWDHVDPYRLSRPGNEGSRRMSVDEFLESKEGNETAKAKLRELLKIRT